MWFVLQNARLDAVRNRTAVKSKSPAVGTPGVDTPDAANKPEAFNISIAECIRRLRAKGEPVTLFGETEKERRLRLRALELLEERGQSDTQGLNEFKKFMEEAETGLTRKEVEKMRGASTAGKSGKSKEGTAEGTPGAGEEQGVAEGSGKAVAARDAEEQILDLSLVKTDPRKVYPLIYYALKVSLSVVIRQAMLTRFQQRVLREWGEFLDERPGGSP
jgi:pre-mRNA-splicing factor 18